MRHFHIGTIDQAGDRTGTQQGYAGAALYQTIIELVELDDDYTSITLEVCEKSDCRLEPVRYLA